MIVIETNKRRIKFYPLKLIKTVATLIVTGALLIGAVDIIRFPECYITTWKYQLENDIKNGDKEAQQYYTKTYINNNRKLFD